MPTQNQVQQWLQTAMLAAGTAALTTTSVAMIYLASCAAKSKNVMDNANEAVSTITNQLTGDKEPLPDSILGKVDSLFNQLNGKEQPPEGSTLGRVNGVMDNLSSVLEQISGQYVPLSSGELKVITDSIYSIPVYHNRFLDAEQKEQLCDSLFKSETIPAMNHSTYIANYLTEQVRLEKEIFIPTSIKIQLVGVAQNFMENNPIKRNGNNWEGSGRPLSMRGYTNSVKRLYGLVSRMPVTVTTTEKGQKPNLTQLASQINSVAGTVQNVAPYSAMTLAGHMLIRLLGLLA